MFGVRASNKCKSCVSKHIAPNAVGQIGRYRWGILVAVRNAGYSRWWWVVPLQVRLVTCFMPNCFL